MVRVGVCGVRGCVGVGVGVRGCVYVCMYLGSAYISVCGVRMRMGLCGRVWV